MQGDQRSDHSRQSAAGELRQLDSRHRRQDEERPLALLAAHQDLRDGHRNGPKDIGVEHRAPGIEPDCRPFEFMKRLERGRAGEDGDRKPENHTAGQNAARRHEVGDDDVKLIAL